MVSSLQADTFENAIHARQTLDTPRGRLCYSLRAVVDSDQAVTPVLPLKTRSSQLLRPRPRNTHAHIVLSHRAELASMTVDNEISSGRFLHSQRASGHAEPASMHRMCFPASPEYESCFVWLGYLMSSRRLDLPSYLLQARLSQGLSLRPLNERLTA